MKKIMLLGILICVVIMFFSCADSKTFTDKKGKEFVAEPYGPANETAKKNDTVIYEISVGNVVCSVLFSETVIVPVWLVGWQIYEPVRLKDSFGR